MSNYSRGRNVELKIVHFLEDCGYTSTRSAGSKGAFDVIAYNGKHVRFIQSKYTNDENRSYAADIAKMEGVEVPPYATKELWIYVKDKGFRKVVFLTGARGTIVIPDKARLIFYDLDKLRGSNRRKANGTSTRRSASTPRKKR